MRLWQKFKFGIFDVDGTLFDNMEQSADAFLEIIKDFKLPNLVRQIHLETNGMNLNDQFKLVFNKYKIEYNTAIIQELNKKFFALRDNSASWRNAPLFPGIKTLLENLKQNGIKSFASSGSNTDEIIFRLKKMGIMEYFEIVLGGDKIPKGLGHVVRFAKFCGLTDQKFTSSAFLISDGPNDMALAKAAGIYAVGVTNTVDATKLKSAGADLVISNINELNKIIL